MSDSKSNFQQPVDDQGREVFLANSLIEGDHLSIIDHQAVRATETIELLRSSFEALSLHQPDDKTIHSQLNCIAMRLANIDKCIELSTKENELSNVIGYQVDRATSITALLLPCFESRSQAQPNDKTIYHALSSVLLELADIQKKVEALAEINDQA